MVLSPDHSKLARMVLAILREEAKLCLITDNFLTDFRANIVTTKCIIHIILCKIINIKILFNVTKIAPTHFWTNLAHDDLLSV